MRLEPRQAFPPILRPQTARSPDATFREQVCAFHSKAGEALSCRQKARVAARGAALEIQPTDFARPFPAVRSSSFRVGTGKQAKGFCDATHRRKKHASLFRLLTARAAPAFQATTAVRKSACRKIARKLATRRALPDPDLWPDGWMRASLVFAPGLLRAVFAQALSATLRRLGRSARFVACDWPSSLGLSPLQPLSSR